MKYLPILGLLVVALFPQGAFAQLSLEMDASVYRYDASQAMIEVNYGIVERALHFEKSGDGWVAQIKASIRVTDENQALIAEQKVDKSFKVSGTKADLDAASADKILDRVALTVPYGKSLTVTVLWPYIGSNGQKRTDTVSKLVQTPFFESAKLALSSIDLASSVAPEKESGNPFGKYGYVITPNPSQVFGDQYTNLYYYTEVYIPEAVADTSKTFKLTERILDGSGREMFTRSYDVPVRGATVPYIGAIDATGLPTDMYDLTVNVSYGDKLRSGSTKRFYYDSGLEFAEEPGGGSNANPDETAYLASEISKMSAADLDERFSQAVYVGTPGDNEQYKKLTSLEDKRKFFFNFWRRLDVSHAKPLATYRGYYDRVAEANEKYTYLKTPGWKTDRGRVFIINGPPSELNEELFDAQAKPYIIWYYYSNNQRLTSGSRPEYVFLDREGGGHFTLVHSNVSGESSNPNWYSREARRLR